MGKPRLRVPFEGPIRVAADVRAFYSALFRAGVNWHPDNRAADVVDADGRPAFDRAEAARLDRLNAACFDAAPDPYRICLDAWRDAVAPEDKPCLRCPARVPIGRVVSLCDGCIARSRA